MPGLEPARNNSPIYDGGHRLDAADVVFRTIEIVAVDDDQVGKITGLKQTAGLFHEFKI